MNLNHQNNIKIDFFQSKLDEIEVLHVFVALFKKIYIFNLEIWTLTLDFVIFLKTLKGILLMSGGYAS